MKYRSRNDKIIIMFIVIEQSVSEWLSNLVTIIELQSHNIYHWLWFIPKYSMFGMIILWLVDLCRKESTSAIFGNLLTRQHTHTHTGNKIEAWKWKQRPFCSSTSWRPLAYYMKRWLVITEKSEADGLHIQSKWS